MKKIFIVIAIFVFSVSAKSQGPVQDKSNMPMDTIVKLGGRKLAVDITKVTATDVYYQYPNKQEVVSLERKQVEKIIYKTGRIEQLNKPLFEMIDETSWEAVLITENKSDM